MTNSFNRNKLNAKNHASRNLQIECLENRELLSVVSPIANPDYLTDSVSALVSTTNPANPGFFNIKIPQTPQFRPPQETPLAVDLGAAQVQSAQMTLSAINTAAAAPITEAPLVVELETPLVQTAPTALAASNTANPTLIGETPLVIDLETPLVQTPGATVLAANNTTAVTKIVVNTLDDTVNSDRYTSLREAIQKATDGTVITFASSLKGKTIYVSRTLVISKKITIDASSLYNSKTNEPGLIIKTGNNAAFTIQGTKSSTIKGIEFTTDVQYSGGDNYPGGIDCQGQGGCSVTVENCHFHKLLICGLLRASVVGVSARFNNCTFSNIQSGIGLLNHYGTLSVDNCTFFNAGSGIQCNSGAYSYISNSSFSSTHFCISNSGPSMSITHCTFTNNTEGFVIENYSGCSVSLQNSLFVKNKQIDGYSCIENSGTFTITNVTIIDSTRTFDNNGTMNVRNSICSNKNNGSNAINKTNCVKASDANLDSTYHPQFDSPCVDAGNNSYSSSSSKDLDGNKRILNGTVDIGCYEYMPVFSLSTTSGKTTLAWEDTGAESYTVQYRVKDTEKWTTKTVKGKTELTVSLKNNTMYEVKVTPKGVKSSEGSVSYAISFAKLGVKVLNKTDDSITVNISNLSLPVWLALEVGIQKQGESAIPSYVMAPGNSGSMDSYTFTWKGNDTLTIKGLNSNTKYNFYFIQWTQYFNESSIAISTTTKLSAATTKACYNTPTIKSISAGAKTVTVNWNTVYGKNSSTPAQKYTIQYAVQGTNSWKTATTSATGGSYTVKNLKPGTTYQFRICASKDNYFLNSLYSGTKTATPY